MIRSVNNKGVEILRKIGIVAMTIAVTLSGCSLFREKENKTIVKWLVPEINLDEGYCVEVNKEYPQSDALKYKNKLYGFGNVVMTGKNGVSYSERYLEETGAKPEDLEGDLIIEEIKSQVKEYIGEGYIHFVRETHIRAA